eukprot:COSAG01_NODE_7717_length_3085_cov_5.519424_3_plen_168_part_00
MVGLCELATGALYGCLAELPLLTPVEQRGNGSTTSKGRKKNPNVRPSKHTALRRHHTSCVHQPTHHCPLRPGIPQPGRAGGQAAGPAARSASSQEGATATVRSSLPSVQPFRAATAGSGLLVRSTADSALRSIYRLVWPRPWVTFVIDYIHCNFGPMSNIIGGSYSS